MKFLEPMWLMGLWAIPVLTGAVVLAGVLRRRGVKRFVGGSLAGALAGTIARSRRVAKAALVIAAAALIALALARPGLNPVPTTVHRTGRDVAILLDVSRSMLAQDLKPSRLERAKYIVRDLLDTARGDRIGIIAFAGSAMVRCPLTTDYSFARLALDSLTPDSVARGGTNIGDAIRMALSELFKEGDDRYRDIILITDGEDQESFPQQAAAKAGERGIRVIAIGLGSELGGAPIPTAGAGGDGDRSQPGYMTYEGKVVESKLDSGSLRAIAEASKDGVFLNVGTGNIQMDKVYKTLIARAERRGMESTERMKYQDAFQVFLGAALVLLMGECLVSERRRRG